MKLISVIKNKIIIISLLIALIGTFLIYYLPPTYPLIMLQNYMYDYYYKLNNKFMKIKDNKPNNILVVTIDPESLKYFLDTKYAKWPWPRKQYADVSQYLINKGAKAIIFNIDFSTPDIDHYGIAGFGKINDDIFYDIIINSKKIILPFKIDLNNESDKTLNTLKIDNINNFGNIKTYKSLIPPYSTYTTNNNNFGFSNIEIGIDNKVRNYIPFIKINNNNYPSLAVATYLLLKNKKLPDSLYLDKNGAFTLNWYEYSGINNTFNYLSFYKIYADYFNEKIGLLAEIPDETFKDKVVFIGTAAKNFNLKNNHFLYQEVFPGIEIHATAYQNLINKEWIKHFPNYFEFPVYFIIIFFLIFLAIKIKPKSVFFILYLLIAISLLALNFYLFVYFNTISYNLIFSIIFVLLIYFLILIFKSIITGNSKRKILKKSMSSYINPNLLKKAIKTDDKLLTKGTNITASVLLIEIINFENYYEKNPPEKVIETLNTYFNKFSDVIIKNKGFINKIFENEIMALFGAPIPFDDHADMSVKSAFDCYNISKELLKLYGLNIRMSINSGEIIVGGLNVSNQKFEYNVTGKCIYIVKILKTANKIFNTDLLIGKETKNLLKEVYKIDYLGQFILNKNDDLFDIYYFKEANKQHKNRFKLMTNAYENNDISSFKRFITYFLENNSDFGPALFYIKHFKNNEDTFGEPIKLLE